MTTGEEWQGEDPAAEERERRRREREERRAERGASKRPRAPKRSRAASGAPRVGGRDRRTIAVVGIITAVLVAAAVAGAAA
jgi:hypothetical protein